MPSIRGVCRRRWRCLQTIGLYVFVSELVLYIQIHSDRSVTRCRSARCYVDEQHQAQEQIP